MSDTGILEKLIEKLDLKLDNIQKEINEFKNGISVNLTNLTNRVEIHETKLQNIDKHFNKSLKDRIVDKIIDGSIAGFSGCVGVFIFFLIFKATGSNILNVLKPLLSGILGA